MTAAAADAPSITDYRQPAAVPGNSVPGTPGRGRRRQLPWVALGALLVAMSMLGFALWSQSQSSRTPVLVAARPIEAGAVIDRTDLVPVPVGADGRLNVLGEGQEDALVGSVARGPIPAGTPLSRALVVVDDEAVPAGRAVVGAVLAPGQYPVGAIRAGDRVLLVRTSSSAGLAGGDAESLSLGEAVVWTAEPLVDGRRELFVSLLVDTASAAPVADVASADRLRLVLLGAG